MNKNLGYILAVIGAIGIAITIEPIKKLLNIQIPGQFSNATITVISLIIFVVGVVILVRLSKSKKVKEVPIYQEKEVVGFRRIKHK